MKKIHFVFTVLLSFVSIHANTKIIGCPTAGLDASITICDTDSTPIFLASLIEGEDIGGIWIRTSGTGGIFNNLTGTYTVALGSTTSTFMYTVNGAFPCSDDSSTVVVNINNQPNAGLDGCLSVLDTDPTVIDLHSVISGEAPAGIWTRSSGTGGTFNAGSGTFTPAIGTTSSTLLYTVTGVSPCFNDTSTATVIINGPPMGQAVDLFCDGFGTLFPNSLAFDWNNVGQTSFNFYYSINGGPIVSGNTLVSNYEVPNVPLDSSVYFNVQPIGNICFPSAFTVCNMLSNTVYESDVMVYYPNPFQDNLNLKYAEPVKSILITNMLGQQVFSSDFNEKDLQINLSHLIRGTYIVKAAVTDTIRTFKIVKN